MRDTDITLDDFPADRANCATCTRNGGVCPRNNANKNKQHNGILYGIGNEPTGIIYRCVHYTGRYEQR